LKYEEDGEDEPGVGDNVLVLDDDIDEDMLKNDIDDDDDIINTFNIFLNQILIQMSSWMIKKNI
jgi:hypothetical protein